MQDHRITYHVTCILLKNVNGRLNLGKIRTNTRHFCRDHQIRIFYQFFLLFNFSIHSCSPVLKPKRTVSVKIRFQVWGRGSDIFITKNVRTYSLCPQLFDLLLLKIWLYIFSFQLLYTSLCFSIENFTLHYDKNSENSSFVFRM